MDTAYELSKALPNKWLNPDGSITDFKGNIISPANSSLVEVYKTSRAIVNKFTDVDGETKTYDQISLDIFVTVTELPKYGEKNKIYLLPADDGMFDEYFYNENNKWDKIGEVKVDLSNYYNRNEIDELLENLDIGGTGITVRTETTVCVYSGKSTTYGDVPPEGISYYPNATGYINRFDNSVVSFGGKGAIVIHIVSAKSSGAKAYMIFTSDAVGRGHIISCRNDSAQGLYNNYDIYYHNIDMVNGTQTINGVKTFSTQPKITVAQTNYNESSTSIPTMKWVQEVVKKSIGEALGKEY